MLTHYESERERLTVAYAGGDQELAAQLLLVSGPPPEWVEEENRQQSRTYFEQDALEADVLKVNQGGVDTETR